VAGVRLPVFPSQANMFVIDLESAHVRPEELQRELLLKEGVFLRAGNYLSPTHGAKFIRASFSNVPGDLDRFERAFPSAMDRLRATAPAAI
jgi:aspartate aminotransferase